MEVTDKNCNRKERIKHHLRRYCPDPCGLYTNQEVVDWLKKLQGELASGVFEKTHADNLRDRDVLIHFETLAKEYGLDDTCTFRRFQKNMQFMGYIIGSYINGMYGERIAKKALKLLTYDPGVKILYNVQLEDGEIQTEYDAIVIAPYGLFVIEVKNWNSPLTISHKGLLSCNKGQNVIYDIPGRKSIKEALLKEYLGDLFPQSFQMILLLPDEHTRLIDNYQKIPVICGTGVAYEIRSCEENSVNLSESQVTDIYTKIIEHHKVQKALCPVNCQEIVEDYSELMTRIEQASAEIKIECEVRNEETEGTTMEEIKTEPENTVATPSTWFQSIDWFKVASCIVVALVPYGIGAVAELRRSYKKS